MNTRHKRRIAITGAAGNLGSKLRVHWWEREDCELVLLDCAPGEDPSIVKADLSQWDTAWVDKLADVDTIIHFAANADPDADVAALRASNIDAVQNLYLAAAKHGVARVILASSVWVMAGRAEDTKPIFADEPVPGNNAYGLTKQFAENHARKQALAGGPVTVALRIGGCPPGANPPIHKNDWEDQCWLSNRDFFKGLDCALDAPVKSFAVVNLTSFIPNGRWDLEHTRRVIGYVPQDRFAPSPRPRQIGLLRRAVRKVRRVVKARIPRSSDVELVSAVECALGESPLWNTDRNCVWFLDITGKQLHHYHPESGTESRISLSEEPGFVVHSDAGGLLLGMGSKLHHLVENRLSIVETVSLPPGARVNDGCVDADGVLWFGSMDRQGVQPAGRLIRYDGTQVTRHGRLCPIVNGPAFSPDGTKLYQADTLAGVIWRFTLRDGKPVGEGNPFVTIHPRDGMPDGLTVDAEGALWVALWGGWAVRRYSSEGKLLATIRFPCANVTKIVFGGPDLKTAYATSAKIGLSPHERQSQPLAGGLFRFDAPAPGLLPHRCRL